MLRLTAVESAVTGKNPKANNLLEASKVVKKLRSSTLRLVYSDLGNSEYLKVIVYGNAIHTSLPDGVSKEAQIVFMCSNMVIPVTSKSKKLERVTKRPMELETMTLAESPNAGYFVALTTKEISGLNTAPKVFRKTDNKSLEEPLHKK